MGETSQQLDTLRSIGDAIAEFEETLPKEIDDILTNLGRLDEVMRVAGEWKERNKAVAVKWLNTNNVKRYVAGPKEWYVAAKKTVKCRDPKALLKMLLQEQSVVEIENMLSSSAWKHGEARKLLGDRFDEFFETTIESDLEGKPIKGLQVVDTRFLK